MIGPSPKKNDKGKMVMSCNDCDYLRKSNLEDTTVYYNCTHPDNGSGGRLINNTRKKYCVTPSWCPLI